MFPVLVVHFPHIPLKEDFPISLNPSGRLWSPCKGVDEGHHCGLQELMGLVHLPLQSFFNGEIVFDKMLCYMFDIFSLFLMRE